MWQSPLINQKVQKKVITLQHITLNQKAQIWAFRILRPSIRSLRLGITVCLITLLSLLTLEHYLVHIKLQTQVWKVCHRCWVYTYPLHSRYDRNDPDSVMQNTSTTHIQKQVINTEVNEMKTQQICWAFIKHPRVNPRRACVASNARDQLQQQKERIINCNSQTKQTPHPSKLKKAYKTATFKLNRHTTPAKECIKHCNSQTKQTPDPSQSSC